MCGIVAILRRPSGRAAPVPTVVVGALERVDATLATARRAIDAGDLRPLADAARELTEVDHQLRGTPGLRCLLGDPGSALIDTTAALAARIASGLADLEAGLDAGELELEPGRRELVNEHLLAAKDACWAIERDRLRSAREVVDLIPPGAGSPSSLGDAAIEGLWAIQAALASLDRLEVRGRDSAGLHVLVVGHGLDLARPELASLAAARMADPLFTSLALRDQAGCLSFVYKAAAEIGELGDNVRALRRAVRSDALLGRALAAPGARCTVVGHTRWASVGIISEANAHPLNSDEVGSAAGPYVTAALNGDVDNYLDIRDAEGLSVPVEVTTDAKVIPALVARRLADGLELAEAWRASVACLDGSVATVASSAVAPDQLHLALRGSGQSLYVGLAEDAYVVASEPYGLVEETADYVRMDGESTRGQVIALSRDGAGTLAGMRRQRYDGAELPLVPSDVITAEITTRDIDRGGYPHFLLKEISEAPTSLRKTLRGRLVTGDDGRLTARLGDDTLPEALVDAVASGVVTRVLVIGQGTAAVAGQAVAAAMARCLPWLAVSATPATELSGFGLDDDMSATLVVAISQSGTTTDTNRTVDLVRSRGAHVIAVVNRRNSDLATKAHGVLYTSDGRDVEMSVASTKAFYAQVAAGWLLAIALSAAAGRGDGELADRHLQALRALPEAMERILAGRDRIAALAAAHAPRRRYWAVVGSGPDRVAAAELRIKLSELCYKSIACDATEDKKHIDLSSEPLILVCAAGLSGPNADDVAKEVAIYRAHKAAPVVIATEGDASRFSGALDVIEVPRTEPDLAFVLSAMVGHLFGYEAALAIDAQALPLRGARVAVEAAAVASGADAAPGDDQLMLARLAPVLSQVAQPFMAGLRDGAYNGHLEAATAVRLVSLLRFATGILPIDAYELETGKVGAPAVIVADLLDALGGAIDELTRPVDAIKHQAKTVTVGITRSEDALLATPLVREALAAGAAADSLGYRALRTLAGLDPAVDAVLGYTRYRIDWPSAVPGRVAPAPTIEVVDQGGIAVGMSSRTSGDPRLRGTKHRAAEEREVTVARGRNDGRTVVLAPEVKRNQVVGMTLLHVRFHPVLPAPVARRVLAAYRNRYAALSDAVTETEPTFDDRHLAETPVVELLTEPVYVLADRWRLAAS